MSEFIKALKKCLKEGFLGKQNEIIILDSTQQILFNDDLRKSIIDQHPEKYNIIDNLNVKILNSKA